MALSKYKLGELIEESFRKNDELEYGIEYVRGISNNKTITQTKADVDESVIHKFYIVNPGEFIYNPRTTRMGDKVGLGYNRYENPLLFSFNNIAFYLKETAKSVILPEYLYMYFNRSEFDRYAITNSWGSATELFSFAELSDIEIDLPSLDIQQKYVDVYNAMLVNQQNYERGLEDLKLVCDGYFDQAKKDKRILLRDLIEKVDKKNVDLALGENLVRGITNQKKFADTKADITDTDLSKFLVIERNVFAYNSRTDGRDMLVLALNNSEQSVLVTWNYNAFKIKECMKESFLPDFLYAYFTRGEFDRNVRFNSWGSSQELLSWDNLCSMSVPIPDIEIQKSIVNIYNCYIERKRINEQLKAQIKDLCPILIKGSIEEGRKN